MLEFSTIFVPSFDPNEWCLKNGLHSGGLNPGPLIHESSALTTRPWLLNTSSKHCRSVLFFMRSKVENYAFKAFFNF
jgi:hypothetical protein